MNHQKLKDLLPLYVDNGLNDEEKNLVEKHLKECEECRNELKHYRQNFNILSSTEGVEPPQDIVESVMEGLNNLDYNIDKEQEQNTWSDKLLNLFRLKVRIPVGAVAVVVAIILSIALFSPGIYNSYQNYSLSREEMEMGQEAAPEQDLKMARDRTMNRTNLNQSSPNTNQEAGLDRKIIQNASLEIETDDFAEVSKVVTGLVTSYEGYIASSTNWVTASGQKKVSFTLRIPENHFHMVLEQIKNMGRVKYSSLGSRDVTEEFIDVEARLDNLKEQEIRYRKLLDRADKVEDILKIERELERVRSTIESLEGRIEYLQNRVSFSTINVVFMEPESIMNSNRGIIGALRQALRAMVESFYNLIIKLGAWLPYMLPLVAGYFIYRRHKLKNKE
ncbi:DUF4349 domain-containing protein [Halothermothrix orenii]|uniref:Anti-sigma-W factor RsiW n=1 Tax=Halothermothrix orenii (strain H 168 / OCM 544 / DSM 9562) TaxID=373903 RepID=B8D1T0_HALOH|nr:DUF4349 domain-containing protein [Halothermothrix orenii]ACL69157.1 putative transmembrane anti-sigma factor [Halothermothrix orenii H 168]